MKTVGVLYFVYLFQSYFIYYEVDWYRLWKCYIMKIVRNVNGNRKLIGDRILSRGRVNKEYGLLRIFLWKGSLRAWETFQKNILELF